MNLKQIAKDTAKVLVSYLTYQAVRVVVAQLSETNPERAIWLNRFSTRQMIQDGEAYLSELLEVDSEMAFRLMTVREYLANETTEFLPEMVQSEVQQANMGYRRQYLERVTQLSVSEPITESDPDSSASADGDIRSDLDPGD
jgi:RbcX protein